MAKSIRLSVGRPEISPAQAINLFKRQIEKAKDLQLKSPVDSTEFENWSHVTGAYIEKAFGINSPNKTKFEDIGKIYVFTSDTPESWFDEQRAGALKEKIRFLNSMIELLQTEIDLRSEGVIERKAVVHGHKVFLVHGHNDALLFEVEKFLTKLGLEIVILRDQPNKGRTIIEKFEALADVAYAVVLLTADDRGGPRSETFEAQKFRARQNVILELGYFLGRLSRERVCALYHEGVEIPSDYSGVLYVLADSGGGWRLRLARELKAAGLSIDMNLAV